MAVQQTSVQYIITVIISSVAWLCADQLSFSPFLQPFNVYSSVANLDVTPDAIAACYKFFNDLPLSRAERMMIDRKGLIRSLHTKDGRPAMMFGDQLVTLGEDEVVAELNVISWYGGLQKLAGLAQRLGSLVRMPAALMFYQKHKHLFTPTMLFSTNPAKLAGAMRVLREVIYYETGCVMNPIDVSFQVNATDIVIGECTQQGQNVEVTAEASAVIRRPCLYDQLSFIDSSVHAMLHWYGLLESIAGFKGLVIASSHEQEAVKVLLQNYPARLLVPAALRLHRLYEVMVYPSLTAENAEVVLNCLLKPLLCHFKMAAENVVRHLDAAHLERYHTEFINVTQGYLQRFYLQNETDFSLDYYAKDESLDEWQMPFFNGQLVKKINCIQMLCAMLNEDVWNSTLKRLE